MKQNYLKKTNRLLNFFTFLLLSIVFTSNAQCPTGGFVLSTQAEVNAFAVNYPNCWKFANWINSCSFAKQHNRPYTIVKYHTGDWYVIHTE